MPPLRTISHCTALVAARIAATLIVRAWGLRALSDDDFSRITIAQGFAANPRLDPTGTSWLPFPFWIQGTAMALFGRSLEVAEVVTAVSSCLAILILYGAARWSGLSPRASLVGALAAAVLPVAAVTGAANVPELPVACCTAAALLLLRHRSTARSWAAAGLLIPATLSRYESWPAALAVAVFMLWPSSKTRLRGAIGPAVLALAGPALWIAWNAHAHGDPLHFHARVAAYHKAIGATAALGSYPIALATELVPAAIVAVVGAVICCRALSGRNAFLRALTQAAGLGWAVLRLQRAGDAASPSASACASPSASACASPSASACASPHASASGHGGVAMAHVVDPSVPASNGIPLLASAFVLIALVAAEARGGAPTHHPERALLAIAIVAWVAAIGLLERATSQSRPSLWVAGSAAVLVIVSGVRLHSMLPGYGVDRSPEVALGRQIAQRVPAGERVAIEPSDYGYFAIMAASGRPEMLTVTRSLDPREKEEPSVMPPDAKWIAVKQDGAWKLGTRN